MQPTGEIHLGNYLGALKQWVGLAKSGVHTSIFGVVDAHAFTAPYDAKELPKRVFETALSFLASGLDDCLTPDSKTVVMLQTDVPAHMELAWYLACVAPMGELGRMTQFKEKSEQHKQSVNAGLFTYPILMAADILVYKATLVPVGADQVQHLEFARDVARHFNLRFGKEVFREPKPHALTLRIKGTDGNEKMSKSRNNAIGILEPAEAVWKKLKGAFTDPERTTRDKPGRPEVCNIYTMHTAVSEPARVAEVDRDCRSAAIGCGDCKKMLAESLERELVPIRLRAGELRREPERVTKALAEGGSHCRARAAETLREVREVMGVSPGVLS
jgi:tryptophanyl-tRNA synthetase